MKYFLLAILLFSSMLAQAQSLKKYAIGRSGCAASFYCNPGTFEESTSPDSSIVFSGECAANGINYQLICVQLAQQAPSMEMAEDVLLQYLDFLKSAYEISSASGYVKGLKLPGKKNISGMAETWRDKDNNYLQLKGWTNGRYLAVLIMVSPKEQPAVKTNPFLDSIVLP